MREEAGVVIGAGPQCPVVLRLNPVVKGLLTDSGLEIEPVFSLLRGVCPVQQGGGLPGTLELLDHLRSDLKIRSADARTHRDPYIAQIAAKLLLEQLERPRQNPRDGPAPACVQTPNYAFHRVVQQDRVAIRAANAQQQPRRVAQQAVAIPDPRPVYDVDDVPVLLVEQGHRGVAELLEHSPLVLAHLSGVVAGRSGEVQAAIGAFGDPALSSGKAVGNGKQGRGEHQQSLRLRGEFQAGFIRVGLSGRVVTDFLQTSLHSLATHHPHWGDAMVFLADDLLFVLGALWVVLLIVYWKRLSRAFVLKGVAALVLTGVLALLLGHLIPDPRPYLAEHYTPLSRVASDNGFPSDHTLIAAFLSGLLWWVDRRWMVVSLVLTGLIGVGRLAIGAHHTLDVAGSLLIVLIAVGAASGLRLPSRWTGDRTSSVW